MAKLSRGKTFVVVPTYIIHWCGPSGRGHHVLYTASDSRGKLSQSAENRENRESFPPQKLIR